MISTILVPAARVVTTLMVLFSVYLLLRGHNAPGGGFAGGLVAASALFLHAMANGVARTRRMLRVEPRTIAVVGIAIAIGSGLFGIVADAPFLTGMWTLPAGLPLGTPLLFDAGVYLVVVGAVTTVVFALEEAA